MKVEPLRAGLLPELLAAIHADRDHVAQVSADPRFCWPSFRPDTQIGRSPTDVLAIDNHSDSPLCTHTAVAVTPDEETQRARSVDTANSNENLRYVEAKSSPIPPSPPLNSQGQSLHAQRSF